MRKLLPFVLVTVALVSLSLHAQRRRPVRSIASDLVFYADDGVRAYDATNPQPGVADDGRVYLYYVDQTRRREVVSTSSDGLTFGAAEEPSSWAYDPRNTRMPDGKTWRRYQYDPRTATMQSLRSTDGARFTPEAGVRYVPRAEDRGSIGVYDAYSVGNDVILLYIGDMYGTNNVRRARSRDRGMTFQFEASDVLGDAANGGGPNSFVDQKSILLPDGRRRLFTMRQHTIYSFISADGGISYTLEPGARLERTAFRGLRLESLNDPVVVRLRDGRHRMYVAALARRADNSTQWVVVSATTASAR